MIEIIDGTRATNDRNCGACTTRVEICRSRDATGQYAAADRGDLVNFPGVSADYEVPLDADLVVDSEFLSVEAITEKNIKAIAISR